MNYDKLIKFLHNLSKNNNKEWFEAHREEYQNLRSDFERLVKDIILGISEFDNKISPTSDPKKAIFRINRDIRFSKDKTPYKTRFSADISNYPRNAGLAGYYFHIDHDGKLYVGGGMWNPEPERLKQIRDHIVQQPEALEDVVYDKKFASFFGDLSGDSLVRVPRGYDENDSLIKYIKLKSFTVWKEYSINKISNPVNQVLKIFKEMYPLMEWLREATT